MIMKERALALHQKVGMIDAHMDLALELLNRQQMGEKDIIQRRYLEGWKSAGLKLLVSSIFIENNHLPEMGLRMALRQINVLKREIESLKKDLVLVTDKKTLDEAIFSNKIGVIISFEGLEPISNDLNLLETFYDLGVRGGGLVWSRRNYVADGSYFGDRDKGRRGGLSSFGLDVVEHMNSKSMFIDVSHLNDEGLADVLEHTRYPILASHSNCRSIYNIKRHLTDDQIRQIAERGGVIGLNNIRPLVSPDDTVDYISVMCDHLDHMVTIGGIESVGFGFDICKGIEETHLRFGNKETEIVDVLDSHQDAVLITAELLKRGYSEAQCKKILIDNMLNYFRKFLL